MSEFHLYGASRAKEALCVGARVHRFRDSRIPCFGGGGSLPLSGFFQGKDAHCARLFPENTPLPPHFSPVFSSHEETPSPTKFKNPLRPSFCFFAFFIATIVALTCFPQNAHCFDEFDSSHAPARFSIEASDLTLDIKGRMRLGLHDLEGEGGPGYDSPTDTATIGTRSPFVDLDSFDLSFRGHWKDMLWLNANVSFMTDETYLSAIYFEYKQDMASWFSHGVEVGYQTPVVATDRHTVRYPFIATNYWRYPEYHIAYASKFELAENTALSIYASLGIMRPLKAEPIHGSSEYRGTFSTISYSSAKAFSGNSPTGTALVRLNTYGVNLDLFGSIGKISMKEGIQTLVSDFPYYRYLPKFDDSTQDSLSYWYGGRIGYNGLGLHVLGEVIASHEHLLNRVGMYVQAGYAWAREDAFWFNLVEFVARYERIWLLDSTDLLDESHAFRSTETTNAMSWNYQVLTLALKSNIISDFVALRVEYTFFWEENGVPALGILNAPVRNNELLFQIEARY